jgi:outer membrane lipoprotein-sorting protein
MASFMSRPALRWLVPTAAAVVVIGGGAAAGTIVASADPALPERSAAQLLADLQTARVDGMSGTVVQRAELGLPPIAQLAAGAGGSGAAELSRLVAGSNTLRVWYAGPEKARVAVLGTAGETDLIRNGRDLWVWRSADNSATHLKLPAAAGQEPERKLPTGVPSTPQEAADAALAAIDPTTKVTTTGSAEVAGRAAYELILTPRDTASLVGQVRMAIDAEHHVPLRVEVYATNAAEPAFRVAFEQVDFAVPDAEQFAFNPPPGATVKDEAVPTGEEARKEHAEKHAEKKAEAPAQRRDEAGEPTTVGTGWTTVVVAKAPVDRADKTVQQLLGQLPEVSGTWGKGRLLQSALFSALLTDDGRLLAGAVAPEKLYEVAAR